MKRVVIIAAAVALATPALAAQDRPALEVRPFVGALVPVGPQRDLFPSVPLLGAQAALELRPQLHLVGELSWAPATTRLTATNDHVHLFSQALGVELSLPRELGRGWTLKPFTGLGAGVRNYFYRAQEFKSQGGPLAYAALGTELQLDALALRLEARGHHYRYRSPAVGGDRVMRNDFGMSLGVAYHIR